MRCGQDLVREGDLTAEVSRKCGEPTDKIVRPPAVRPDGNLREGAVTVEIWIYGPENGVYHYVRFINSEVVKIWTEREAL